MFSFNFNAKYNNKYLKKNTINSFAKQNYYIPKEILIKDIFPKANQNIILNENICFNNITFFDKILLDSYYKRDLLHNHKVIQKKNIPKMVNKSTQTDNVNNKDNEDFILIDIN